MAKQDDEKNPGKTAPPYLSALTFRNALNFLTENGLPEQIDRGILTKFSGADQRALFHAFKYLGFTDSTDKPTRRFHEYDKGDADARKAIIAVALTEKYPNQIKVLQNGTPQQLQTSFGEYAIENSVRQKCISFFLKLGKEAGFSMSNYIAKSIRTTGPRKATKTKPKNANGSDTETLQKDAERGKGKDPADSPPQPGMVAIPIPIGPNKTWEIRIPEKPDSADVLRFIQVVKIVLGVEK